MAANINDQVCITILADCKKIGLLYQLRHISFLSSYSLRLVSQHLIIMLLS